MLLVPYLEGLVLLRVNRDCVPLGSNEVLHHPGPDPIQEAAQRPRGEVSALGEGAVRQLPYRLPPPLLQSPRTRPPRGPGNEGPLPVLLLLLLDNLREGAREGEGERGRERERDDLLLNRMYYSPNKTPETGEFFILLNIKKQNKT